MTKDNNISVDYYKLFVESSRHLEHLQKKFELFMVNNATVPKHLQKEYDDTFSRMVSYSFEYMSGFLTSENIERLEEYEKSLPAKIERLIGKVSDIPRAAIIQCMSAAMIFCKQFITSELADPNCVRNLDYLFQFMKKYCEREYLKTDLYKRKDFDYSEYFCSMHGQSLLYIINHLIENIESLLHSSSDEEFYFKLELIDIDFNCYVANLPCEFYL